VPLVAFDSNVIDLWAEVLASDPRMGESMEALALPPYQLSSSSHAIYWLAALARSWPSCLYTFSDLLYEEVAAMPPEKRQYALHLFALAAELREAHPEEYRVVTVVAPSAADVAGIGLATADARHIADAIKLGAAYFLTCDRGMLKRAVAIRTEWCMDVLLPEDFLLISVHGGAPWPNNIPWPWEHAELRDAALRLGMTGNDSPG
jgi:hypothetical protein